MRERLIDGAMVALAALLGLAFCWLWAGPAVLDPMSSGWLQSGDRAMHTLGWWFFREAPWGTPPGASPLLGLELSSSVALSDSLPLFAFPFKLMAAWLPERFQYWGLWFALSFVLQAVFGYLIGRELGLGRWVALLAALFCLIQPAFLNRIGGHMALGGHWTILVGLYLYLRRVPPQTWAWPLLLAVVSAIHGYLLVMCFGLWVAALGQRWWLKRTSRPLLLVEAVLAAGGIALVLWGTGTLMVSSLGSGGGYGLYRLNLLSLFDSERWSRFWPDIPQRAGDYEGLNFPGTGVFALIILVLAVGPRPRLKALLEPRWLPLAVICTGLTLFAVTNHLGLAGLSLPVIPVPEPLGRFAQIFRSSGRMFWPVGYLILFVAVLFASRRLGRWAVPALAVLLVGQAVDTSVRWAGFRGVERMGPVWEDKLADPAWDVLGEHYARVRGLPVTLQHPDWMELSYFALQHGIGTDAAYLGRIDGKALAARVAAVETEMATGAFEPDSLYVLDLYSALRVAPWLRPGDVMTKLDGMIVFAPDGAQVLADSGIVVERYVPERNVLPAGERMAVTGKVAADYLLAGWWGPEDWGSWSEGKRAVLEFRNAVDGPSYLQFEAMGFLLERRVPQHVEVVVNGQPAGAVDLMREPAEYMVPLPELQAGADVTVEFLIGAPAAPADRYGTGDVRTLGLGLSAFAQRPGALPAGAGSE